MRMPKITLLALVVTGCASEPPRPTSTPESTKVKEAQVSPGDSTYELLRTDRKAFAEEVSKGHRSDLERSKAIVLWLTGHLDWHSTDRCPSRAATSRMVPRA
jgi:hypothetical protein